MYSFKAKFLAILITANLIIFGAILTPLSLADEGISVDADLDGLRDAVENGELDCSRDCENNSGNNENGDSQGRRHRDLPEVNGNDISVNDNSSSQGSGDNDGNEGNPSRRHTTLPTVRGNDIHVSYSLAGLREYVQNSQASNNGNQGNQDDQDQPTPTPTPPAPQQSPSENSTEVSNSNNEGATYSGDNQMITNNIYNETNIYNINTTNNYGYSQAQQYNQVYGQAGLNYTFYEITSYNGVPTYVYYLPQTVYSPIYQPILQRIVQTTYWY